MKTKLITSLNELEPGMKTKDGWRVDTKPDDFREGWNVSWLRGGEDVVSCYLWDSDIEELFIEQKVEVPE